MSGQLHAKIIAKFYQKTKNWCHRAVIEGYQLLIAKGIDFREYEEEDISKALCLEMIELDFVKQQQITIVPEYPLHGKKLSRKVAQAKDADIIDFRFSKWKLKKEITYFGEAKNLSFQNWTKSHNKALVNASSYRGRYIDTGIKNLLSGKYALLNGFLIAYVVNGSTKENLTAINKLIQKRKITPQIGLIKNQKTISNYSDCYTSKNSNKQEVIDLQHIFLAFDTNSSI